MQAQPVLDQVDNDLVGDEAALFCNLRRFQPKRRAEVAFAPQNRAGRSDRNTEMARDHFRLRSFSGTGRAEKHESTFHLAAVEEDRHSADDENGDADIKPHQRSLLRRLAAAVSRQRSKARPRMRPLRRNPS